MPSLPCLLLLVVALATLRTYGQAPNVIPPSPNAASLGKFADLPMSYYTGTPQISVPIWEVKGRALSLPISLGYQAGGVKVEETASWTGLGWSLSAGGVIGRSVHGLPDDATGSNNTGYMRLPAVPTLIDLSTYNTFKQFADGQADGQPDVFFFQFGGRSGKFVIDKDGKAYTIPDQRLEIIPAFSPTTGEIVSWRVRDESGIKYTFDQAERTMSVPTTTDENGGNAVSSTNPTQYNSSWYLSRIATPQATSQEDDVITLQYVQYNLSYDQPVSQTRYQELIGVGKAGFNVYNKIQVTGARRLEKILFANGEVRFTPGAARCDLVGDRVLQEVTVVNTQGTTVRRLTFDYSYFDANGVTALTACGTPTTHDLRKRLKLDAVREWNGASLANAYRFEYEQSVYLPSRFSAAQDHWGYYNGQTVNASLIPAANVDAKIAVYYTHTADSYAKLVEVVSINKQLSGADRNPVREAAVAGSLKKITYPTGGHTTFSYELNDCESTQLPNDVTPTKYAFINSTETLNTKSFTIAGLQKGVYALINPIQVPCITQNCMVYYTIFNSSGNPVYGFNADNNRRATVYLTNGTYTIQRYISSSAVITEPYEFTVSWREELPTTHKKAGGLRLRQQVDHDPVSGQELVKTFEYKLHNGLSAGSIINVPDYGYTYNEGGNAGGSYYVRTTTPNYPLALTQGSPVGYSWVTVFHGSADGSNGKSMYHYFSPKNHPDAQQDLSSGSYTYGAPLGFPFTPPNSKEWKRGLLRETTVYRKAGVNFFPVKRSRNHYEFYDEPSADDSRGFREFKGVVVGYAARGATERLAIRFFKFTTAQYVLLQSTEQVFDDLDTTKLVTSTTDYTYSSQHLQLQESLQTASDGSVVKTNFLYAADVAVTGTPTEPAARALQVMGQRHVLNAPVEKRTWRKLPSETGFKLIGGELTTYLADAADGVYPRKTYAYRAIAPHATPAATQVTTTGFSFDGYNPAQGDGQGYDEAAAYAYTSWGKLREYTPAGSDPVIYLWGHNNQYPVAEIRNATYSQVKTALGITAAEIDFGTGTLTQAQAGALRTNLPKAMITTYTYTSLKGIASKTDPNGTDTFYEYDDMGRLVGVKDHLGNLVKHYEYQYKQ